MHGEVYRLMGGLAAYTLLVANIINVSDACCIYH